MTLLLSLTVLDMIWYDGSYFSSFGVSCWKDVTFI